MTIGLRTAARFTVACSLVLGAAIPRASAQAPATRVPTLVVFITVDQLRGDYLERFDKQLSGGLARLYREGAVFTRGHQDHAITETAPGHASVLSGRFPRSTGIVTNSLGVLDPQAPLVGAAGPGASPFRFRGGTLTDWLRVKDPRTRALSVSRKDRGAILPLGRAKQQVFWYPGTGNFTTSTYYADTLPTWVQRFNARRLPQSYAGKSWTLLLPESAYPEPDSVPVESAGEDFTFPHAMPPDTGIAARTLANYPWMDDVTAQLALAGLAELKLGAGPQTDVLAISLSTTDAIGHRFGPDSRELHDQILRLDRVIGAFLDSLYKLRDPATVVVALTADHGVSPYPEARQTGAAAAAMHVDYWDVFVASILAPLVRRGVDTSAVRLDEGMLFVDRETLARAHIDADSLVRAFVATIRKVPGVLRVDRVRDLAADTTRAPIARRWSHMIPPDFPVEAVITLKPYYVAGQPTVAMHGTPHDYDTHVPIIFFGTPFKPGKYDELARTVDIAPTLARVTATRPTERLDGHVLEKALKR
jgi:predicted AlkP superfamily pyrophosphatase or phosphodiesterase